MTKTRKQRSTAELIAEAQAQLAKRIARAARKEALADPDLAPLVEQIQGVKDSIRDAKKLTGDGPQGSATRIAKHEVWIARIEQERAEADSTISSGEATLAELEAQLAEAVAAKTAEA